jgi:hypothetical protein
MTHRMPSAGALDLVMGLLNVIEQNGSNLFVW